MPAAVAFVATAFASASAAVATFATSLSFASGLAAGLSAWGTVASIASLAIGLTAKPPGIESAGQQVNVQLAGASAPLPIMFGRSATGGLITYRDTGGGTKNPILWTQSILSIGPVSGFGQFYAEDRLVTFNTSPARPGSATGLSTFAFADGLDSSSKLYKDGGLQAAWTFGEWTDTRTLNGIAGGGATGAAPNGKMSGLATGILKHTLNNKADNFTNGVPGTLWVLSGQLLYDPRKDSTYPGGSGSHRLADPATYEFSENPYVMALGWAAGRWVGTKRLWGIGADFSEIDVAAFVAGANLADANGWKAGGQVTTGDDKFAVLSQLLAAGGGVPLVRGAQISCFYNSPKTSVFSITQDDVVGSIKVTTTQSLRDRINRIVPSYREENQRWQVIAGDEVTSATYVTEDGGLVRSTETTYALVQNAAQAKQLGSYELTNSREFLTVDLVGKPRLLNAQVGEAVMADLPEVAITNRKFIVVSREFDAANQVVNVQLRSETDAKHAFALGQTATAPASPAVSTFDPSNPEAPGSTAWAITSTSIATSNGVSQPALIVTGANDNPNTAKVIFSYRILGATEWTSGGFELTPAGTRIEITGLQDGAQYQVGVQVQTGNGALSPYRILGPATVGQTVSSTVRPGGIDWTAPTVTAPITNIPPALSVDGSGRLQPGNITVGPSQTLTQFATTVNTATTTLNTGLATLTTATTDLDNRLDAVEPVVLASGTRLTSVENRTTAVESGKTSVTDFNALKLRTDTAEGTISAHTGQISTLNTTVAGKASASDLSALGVRVTSAEGVNTAQNSRLTTVETDVAGKASASSVAVLAATVSSQGAMNDNATFALGLTGGVPTSWSSWNNGTGTIVAGQISDKAVRYVAATDEDKGILQYSRRKSGPGWFVIEAVVTLVSGSLEGAGVLVAAVDSSNTGTGANGQITFSADNDISGSTQGNGLAGRTYTFTKLFRISDANFTTCLLYAMTNWLGTGTRRAKTLDWHMCAVREASAGEVETGIARGGFTSVSAKISDVANVAASATSAAATRVSVLETLAKTIPNKLPNSDGAQGARGWTGSFVAFTDTNVGSYFNCSGSGDRYHVSDLIAVNPNSPFTFSFEGDGGSVPANGGVYFSEFDSSGNYLASRDGQGFRNFTGTGWFVRTAGNSWTTGPATSFVKCVIWKGPSTSYVNVSRIMVVPGTEQIGWSDEATVRDVAARITSTAAVAADAQGKANATFGVYSNVNGKISGIQSVNTGTTSTFDILADTFRVSSGSSTITPMVYRNGQLRVASVMVDELNAGASMTVGSAKLKVQVQPFDLTVTDGQSVAFGYDLGNNPSLTFLGNNLTPLNSGETYRLYADNLTPTGFIARLKIETPAAPSNLNTGLLNANPNGPTSHHAYIDGYGGRTSTGSYDVRVKGTIRSLMVNPNYGSGGAAEADSWYQDGYLEIGVWGWNGGAWVTLGSIQPNFVYRSYLWGPGYYDDPYDETVTIPVGTNISHIGVAVAYQTYSSSISQFGVAWQTQGSGGGLRSATPGGQVSGVTVRPRT